ncbi:hypothetical protein CDD81_1954 [Ophiocordyceps australis]|uniref:cAMP-dependent protein kinase n=1 Tax=Ophiocordyceps australis TaxID=1399860 RepID=A0A2C5XZ18_9HYPO|nr:hypothetical protein CDD81_1954 [Ophiocordyceps australis]
MAAMAATVAKSACHERIPPASPSPSPGPAPAKPSDDAPSPLAHLSPADFDLVRTLGTGTFARVCLVQPSSSSLARALAPPDSHRPRQDSFFALKILRKAEVVRLKQVDHVRHERSVLAALAGHPFITTLRASFSDAHALYMLLDFVPGGELFTYLRRLGRFDEHIARFYAAEIVLVLDYLHGPQAGGVAYRDLKPENLLLDKDGHIRLVDFGFAKRLGGDGPVETYTLCGTPEYLAPEVIQNKGHSTAVDWWALGVLVYEFLTGYPPFWHQNPIEIYKQIIEKPVRFPQSPQISHEAKHLILSLCTVDRSRRLGNVSGGAARVKAHPFFRGLDWNDLLSRRRPGPIIPPIRYPGDAQCFDTYPEDDGHGREYTPEMAERYDHYFEDF